MTEILELQGMDPAQAAESIASSWSILCQFDL